MTSEDVPNMWKRGPFYYLGTRDANGKLHWKSSKCRTKAEALALIANGGIKENSPEMTISQFITLISERLSGVLGPGTIRNYKDSLLAFQTIVGDKPLNEITSDSVETFKQKRRSQVEPGTVNRDLRNLKSLFSRAQRNYKLVSQNPFSRIEMLSNIADEVEVAFMTEEELLKFLPAVKEKLLKDIYLVLAYTGLRISELLQLQPEDIALDAGLLGELVIRTDEEFKTKTAKSNRRVPIAPQVRRILEERMSSGHKLLFCKPGGFPISRSLATVRFKGYIKQTGFNLKMRLHGLRHTFVAMAIMKGVDLSTIQRWLGHANMDMINKVYSHITDQHSQLQMSKLSTFEETEEAIQLFDAEQAKLFVKKIPPEEVARRFEKKIKQTKK